MMGWAHKVERTGPVSMKILGPARVPAGFVEAIVIPAQEAWAEELDYEARRLRDDIAALKERDQQRLKEGRWGEPGERRDRAGWHAYVEDRRGGRVAPGAVLPGGGRSGKKRLRMVEEGLIEELEARQYRNLAYARWLRRAVAANIVAVDRAEVDGDVWHADANCHRRNLALKYGDL